MVSNEGHFKVGKIIRNFRIGNNFELLVSLRRYADQNH